MHETKIYQPPIGSRLLLAAVFAACLLFCLYIVFTTGRLPAMAFAMLSAYMLADALVSRVEIDGRVVRSVGALRTQEMPIADIRGYRVSVSRNGRWLLLESRNHEKLSIRAFGDLEEWARETLSQLDEIDGKQELEQALASHALGRTEEERLDAIERARTFAVWLSVLAGLTSAWALFIPLARTWFELALLAFPAVALVAVRKFHGALRVVVGESSMLPSVFLTLALPSFAIGIRGMLDWQVASTDGVPAPLLIVSAVAFWSVWRAMRPNERNGQVVFVLAIMALSYGYGCVMTLNGVFDTAPATVFQPRVVSKRVRQSKSRGVVSRQPYLKVERWRPKGARQEFRVSRAVYDAYKVGDRLTIELKPGALGIPLYRLRVRSRR